MLCAATASALLVRSALADTYPSRPIKLVLGFSAGSATDSLARPFADKLADALKASVIVDNKPSGGQLAAIQALLAAPADGYTLYLGTGSSMAQGPGLRKDIRHDPLRDFSPVAYVATGPGALIINADLPIHNVGELIARLKAEPGKFSFGSSGVGAAGHLSMELFMARTGTRMVHIPYKADTEAAREVAAGTLQAAVTTLRTAATFVRSGKVRALITLDTQRSALLDQTPSINEVTAANLRDLAPYTWYALVGPRGLPEPVVKRLSEACRAATAAPDYVSAMQNAGVLPEWSTPEELQALTRRELDKWREVGKTLKIEI
jgi:tripartite-type tricarboxylate transporter receptor subunit TctC